MTYREKAVRLTQIAALSEAEHETLKTDGANDHRLWSDINYQHKVLVDKFRAEVKKQYWYRQAMRCCYCSTLLQDHGRLYDAEHILDKSGFPEFMFHPENIAVACVLCNQYKSDQPVLCDERVRPLVVPTESDDYKILHPHLDEWTHHLRFDEVGRIIAVDGSSKGEETIAMCKMYLINLAQLAMKFAPDRRESAHDLMCKMVECPNSGKIEIALALMKELAEQSPEALAVVETLRELIESRARGVALRARRAAREAMDAAADVPISPDAGNW